MCRHLTGNPAVPVFAVLLLVLPVQASAQSLEFCFESENVRPWRTKDGKGLSFELLDQVAVREKISFRYTGLPWKRCLHELKAGRYAGAIGSSFKPERVEFGVYPGIHSGGTLPDARQRLNIERYVVVRRKDSPVDWDGRAFHRLDKPAGAPLGYSAVGDLRAAGVPVDDGAQTAADVLQKLLAGRVDAAVLQQGEVVALLAGDTKLRERVEVLARPFAEKPYYLMLSYSLLQSDPDLAERVWSAIARERERPPYRDREARALGLAP